mgnify:CR=1 FL=1
MLLHEGSSLLICSFSNRLLLKPVDVFKGTNARGGRNAFPAAMYARWRARARGELLPGLYAREGSNVLSRGNVYAHAPARARARTR